jgi:hypothetical protein
MFEEDFSKLNYLDFRYIICHDPMNFKPVSRVDGIVSVDNITFVIQ